jgi:hypothetical protein
MNESVDVAQRYLQAGLCVLPIRDDGSKYPLLPTWAEWQHKLPAPQEVTAWFTHCEGYGLVCGRISRDLEVIDFDDAIIFAPWYSLVEAKAPGLVARLPRDETPGLGHHVYYRCAEIAGNMKLARSLDGETLIETRGEGGFIVVPPTDGRYHAEGKPYRMLNGDLAAIPTITPQERDILLDAAESLNQYTPRIVETPKEPGANAGNRPGDRWAAAHTWADILQPHGWKALGQRGQTIYWQRPGKDGPGNSATTGHNANDILYVFSSNALPFDNDCGYSKFTAYTLLNHGGDFTQATKEVVAQGYGDPPGSPPLPEEPPWMGGARSPDAEDAGAGIAIRPAEPQVIDAAPGEEPSAEPPVTKGLPKIYAAEQNLPVISGKAWRAIQAANVAPYMFLHGDAPSRLNIVDDHPVLDELSPDILRHECSRAAIWFKYEKNRAIYAKPPPDVMLDMLAAREIPLPHLTRIVEAPVFAPDGALQTSPGYHAASRTYYRPAPGVAVPTVAENPSAADVESAKALILDELIGEFPFVAQADRAHAVALQLLPFARDLIAGPTPNHLIEGSQAGVGKGLLADVLLIPALGHEVALITEARDPDEWRKRITSSLRQGKAAILIDNVVRPLDSGHLAAALTASIWTDRVLGLSDNVALPVRCVWLTTGNNPVCSTEIARRSIRIRLDPKVDRPWLREGFKHPSLREWATEYRGQLIWAALTLIQSWIADDRPQAKVRLLGTFEEWARILGSILAHADIPGFLANLDEFYEQADAEGTIWREFVATWWDNFQGETVTAAALFPLAVAQDSFDLGTGKERSQRTHFGMALSKQRDRVIGDFKIVRGGTERRAAKWNLLRAQLFA